MEFDIEMSKVAFDLDGIFIPDCDYIPKIGGLSEFYSLAYYMRPIFKPAGEWYIITGRDPKYRSQTMAWVDRHFENKPKMVWHEVSDQKPEEYKAEIINQNEIKVFIESDINQVQYLLDNTKAQIIHFDMYTRRMLNFTG